MTRLAPYISEANGIAEELAYYLRGPLMEAAHAVARSKGIRGITIMSAQEVEDAYTVLASTPAKRDKILARVGNEMAATVVMRARYLGILAGRAMEMADEFEFIPGQGYRAAAEYAARSAARLKAEPTLSEILPGWNDRDFSNILAGVIWDTRG